MSSVWPVGVLAVLATFSCGKKPDADRDPARSGSATRSDPRSADPAAAGPHVELEHLAVDTAAVRARIDAWLAAQNTGNFVAYSALYEDRLEGVKRVGARTWRFDRKGWLADRKRMFAKPMTVEADDIVIRGNSLVADVTLTQTYTQGRFHDRGTKQIRLVRGATGYLIVREEMLPSVVTMRALDEPGHLVVSAGLGYYAIIGEWGTPSGPLEDLGEYRPELAIAPTKEHATELAFKALAADGTSCAVTGEPALSLISGGTPTESKRLWEALSEADATAALFDMSTPFLVQELLVPKDCRPLYVVPAGSPARTLVRSPTPTNAAAATRALHALPEWQSLQEAWVSDGDGDGPGQGDWDGVPSITEYSFNSTRYVVVSSSVGSGCGDFTGQVTAAFVERGGALVRMGNDQLNGTTVDALVMDATGHVFAITHGPDDPRNLSVYDLSTPSPPSIDWKFRSEECGC